MKNNMVFLSVMFLLGNSSHEEYLVKCKQDIRSEINNCVKLAVKGIKPKHKFNNKDLFYDPRFNRYVYVTKSFVINVKYTDYWDNSFPPQKKKRRYGIPECHMDEEYYDENYYDETD